jgi:hypothetical protein
MLKLALFPILLVAGCIVAGTYGALHDQISYTVSPDYFHALKFQQFDIPVERHNRIGAAIVGWRASWWMGVLIGVPVLLIGLVHAGWKAYLSHSLIAFAVVALTSFAVGMWALVDATHNITEESVSRSSFPGGVSDKVAFARVGNMHNFSYFGGFVGIVTASLYLIVARLVPLIWRWKANRLRREQSPPSAN